MITGPILLLECLYGATLLMGFRPAYAYWFWNIQAFREFVGIVLIFAGAVGFGLFRGMMFHPATPTNAGYREWFAITPYTGIEPLPQGPVQLVWQDLLILIPLTALGIWHLGWDGLYVPCATLGSYLVCILFCLAGGRAFLWFYVSAFALAVAIYFGQQPAVCLSVLIVAYDIASLGVRRSLLYIVSIEARRFFVRRSETLIVFEYQRQRPPKARGYGHAHGRSHAASRVALGEPAPIAHTADNSAVSRWGIKRTGGIPLLRV